MGVTVAVRVAGVRQFERCLDGARVTEAAVIRWVEPTEGFTAGIAREFVFLNRGADRCTSIADNIGSATYHRPTVEW
jgi:hypothetical protein